MLYRTGAGRGLKALAKKNARSARFLFCTWRPLANQAPSQTSPQLLAVLRISLGTPIWRQRVKHAISVGRGPCSCTRACWCATCAAASTRSAPKSRLPAHLPLHSHHPAAAAAAVTPPLPLAQRLCHACLPAGLCRGDAGVPDRHQRCPLLQVRICRTWLLLLPARCLLPLLLPLPARCGHSETCACALQEV